MIKGLRKIINKVIKENNKDKSYRKIIKQRNNTIQSKKLDKISY
jgi:hypothetical protein